MTCVQQNPYDVIKQNDDVLMDFLTNLKKIDNNEPESTSFREVSKSHHVPIIDETNQLPMNSKYFNPSQRIHGHPHHDEQSDEPARNGGGVYTEGGLIFIPNGDERTDRFSKSLF